VNLVELIIKRDPHVRVEQWSPESGSWEVVAQPKALLAKVSEWNLGLSGVFPFFQRWTVRGLLLRPSMRVVVKQARLYWPAFARGHGIFKFRSANRWGTSRVEISWHADSGRSSPHIGIVAGRRLAEVSVPAAGEDDSDLVIRLPENGGPSVFFGVHRLLKRKVLYSRCRGAGVEIGPGPAPQILPGARTAVRYVEQATPEAWQELYGKDRKLRVDSSAWQHYVMGNADAIPAGPESLDFIFSSHVVEHLANPLGHLAYWATLLKTGGVVAAVIPDHTGCKDYVFSASTMDELEREYRLGSMSPTLSHYGRWARHRAPNTDPQEILDSGRSIHVHFYTPESMERILEKMHGKLGFRRFTVTGEHNHKDFFILLEK
jgi:SAM-dependent methyltransferase